MAKKNVLVISVDFRETRVALIEDGIIAELHLERRGARSSTVGNVYVGKVTRVLPGLQAAFIDIGQERAAFLHVEDLIRPDDFEAYLAGSRKSTLTEESVGESEVDDDGPIAALPPVALPPSAEASSLLLPDSAESSASLTAAAPSAPQERTKVAGRGRRSRNPPPPVVVEPVEAAAASQTELEGPPSSDSSPELEGPPSSDSSPELEGPPSSDSSPELEGPPSSDSSPELEAAEASQAELEGDDDSQLELDSQLALDDEDEDDDALDEQWGEAPAPVVIAETFDPETTVAVSAADLSEMTLAALGRKTEVAAEDPAPRPAKAARHAKSGKPPALELDDLPGFTISEPGEPMPEATAALGREGGRRRRRRGRKGSGKEQKPVETRQGGSRRSGGNGGGGGMPVSPLRISKSTPIREVVKEGQEIVVQVSKDPISTKGARCTSHVSLPGRYVVYLPTVEHVGVSKRIGSEKERGRLREAIDGLKPPSGGFIVRTVAEGLTKKQLKQDVGYLVRVWGDVAKKREGARAPTLLSSELDLVLKTARDLFTDEVEQIVIDDKTQHERLVHFIEMFAPERTKDVVLYSGEEPIFDAYGIEDEIQRALARKVPLPSGGYLIIDQAEALTAIDVNTGRFVGKGSKDMEETVLQTNLEAVHEIAYQLRFRNIGGLIILDLIDMERAGNREKVRRTLEELLQKDKAKTTLNRISDLGLIEMTRKRTRESLGRLMHEPCFYCDGTGQLQSKETIAFEILRDIRRKRSDLPGYSIVVNAHPAVCDLLTTTEKAAVADAENRFMRKITVVPRKDYHLEQFDIQGK